METYEEFINNILENRGRFECGEEYHETHHILPRCMGGTDDEENLIDLFAREHFEAHRLLALENPKIKGLVYAWWCMSYITSNTTKQRYKITAKEYEEVRTEISKIMTGSNNPMYGKHHTEKEKERLCELFSGKNNPFYGKRHTEEAKNKISKANKGKLSGKQHPRCREVFCIELNCTFWGAKEAEILYGINKSHIAACCKGKRKTAGGYHWVYKEDYDKLIEQND